MLDSKRLAILIISITLLCLLEAIVSVAVYDICGKLGITGHVAVAICGVVCALLVGGIALVGQIRKKGS